MALVDFRQFKSFVNASKTVFCSLLEIVMFYISIVKRKINLLPFCVIELLRIKLATLLEDCIPKLCNLYNVNELYRVGPRQSGNGI